MVHFMAVCAVIVFVRAKIVYAPVIRLVVGVFGKYSKRFAMAGNIRARFRVATRPRGGSYAARFGVVFIVLVDYLLQEIALVFQADAVAIYANKPRLAMRGNK